MEETVRGGLLQIATTQRIRKPTLTRLQERNVQRESARQEKETQHEDTEISFPNIQKSGGEARTNESGKTGQCKGDCCAKGVVGYQETVPVSGEISGEGVGPGGTQNDGPPNATRLHNRAKTRAREGRQKGR